jgi:hypothetical protein
MDLSQSLNLNTAVQKPLFTPTYLNLEYVFNKILNFFSSIFGYGSTDASGRFHISFLGFLLFLSAVFFMFMIAYCFIRILEIRKKEKEYLEHEIEEYAHHQAQRMKKDGSGHLKNERWEHVLQYLASSNPSDWKLAIMEADSMLEDLTDQMETPGENLGERLKASDPERFKSLDDAWEAHLVRNRIAHEGSQFELSQHEANRVVTLYENVFREFGHI